MRGQIKIVACATPRKLTVTVLGLKSHHCSVGSFILIKLSVFSKNGVTESAQTMKVHVTSRDVTLHETVTFNLSNSLRNRRFLIEAWSSSASPGNFIGCTSFGLRKLTESSEVVQGYYYLLDRNAGCRKHLSVKPIPWYPDNSNPGVQYGHMHLQSWSKRRSSNQQQRKRLLEHKEINIPVTILQSAEFGCFEKSPPTVESTTPELNSYDLKKRDVILSVGGTVVSLHTSIELENLLKSLSGEVILKIQRINAGSNLTDSSIPPLKYRKRKLDRRHALHRKKRRLASQINPPRAVNSGIILPDKCSDKIPYANPMTVRDSDPEKDQRSNSGEFCTSEYLECTKTIDQANCFACSPPRNFTLDEKQPDISNSTKDNGNEYQLCTARLTYGKHLERSAKIVRRRTIQSKAQVGEKLDGACSTTPFLRKSKGRRSFILKEFSGNGIEKQLDSDEHEHLRHMGTMRSAASEADLRKPKRYSSIRPAFRLPFGGSKESNNTSKTNQPENDKLKKLFRMRSRKLKEEKYPNDLSSNANSGLEDCLPGSLMSVLKEKGKCANFRSFLAMEHSEENLAFWLDCESYKSKKQNKRRKAADAMFRKFIQNGAENEVNITADIRAKIQQSLHCPTTDIFLEAQQHIYRLMESDPYRRFTKRPN